MTTAIPEAAVEAAARAIAGEYDRRNKLKPGTWWSGPPYRQEFARAEARAALTAARPLMEAEGIHRVYSIHEPSESDENLRARCRGCGRCWVESADQPGRYIKACPTIEALGLGVWAATIAERTQR